MKRLLGYTVLSLGMFLSSCGNTTFKSNSERLNEVIQTVDEFRSYDRSEHPLGRFEDSLRKKESDFAQKQITVLKTIDAEQLSETEQISLELLKFKLQDRIDAYNFKMHHNTIQADQGFHLDLNYQVHALLSYQDARHYLDVLNDIPHFTEQQIDMLRLGIKEGIAQPKAIFKGYENSYDLHITGDAESNFFFGPFKDLPSNLTEDQKDSILNAAEEAITKSVIPSFKRIKKFFEEEYYPNAREEIGVSSTPGGKEFYQNRINFYTTTDEYTAEDIHNLGLKEVARIRKEMDMIIDEIGFKGTFEEFLQFLRTDKQFYATTGDNLLKEARNIAKKIDAQLPKFFKTLPRKPYGVIKVPDALAPKYTGGRYSGSSSNTEPGYYLVNTYKLDSRPLYILPALTAHEAVPGHHIQGSLNQELGDSIPEFRKQYYLSAYGEGWALYTEYLADEMGIYETPYEKFGQLTYEMWRACRLVVDTGIHAMGWTRQEAVTYLASNTALSIHEVNTETDRYIGWPGQAISYKIGELKIRELRRKAEKALGQDFNIREFHEIILEQGTVTLPILERRVNEYIAKTLDERSTT
ncbi:DUF885 domain-containing protein [Robertkochia solimangrovi]|uniref:DUF885 domain-containing protein n=1 Tax=Robertkochia solimangrovi TaxID=2213046 RepID=UPI0011808617|nr:DUF885 domain-containing protein [Robertkochia solimangrovi]TRZ46304.1 DUF885 domain-containing protein [Robertkochia solimangrovi]